MRYRPAINCTWRMGLVMRAYTRYQPHVRAALGLPELATEEDVARSVETSGVPTDFIKVLAEKAFGVEYCFVTPIQRENAKKMAQRGMF